MGVGGSLLLSVLSVCYSQETQLRVGQCRTGLSRSGPDHSSTEDKKEIKGHAEERGL